MTFLEFLATEWPAVVCFVAGIALVTIECFLPGFGLPGISGSILLLVGIALGAQNVTQAILLSIGTVCILALLFTLMMRSATKGKLSRSALILHQTSKTEDGYTANEEAKSIVGMTGVAETELRPAGVATIGGRRYDVVSDGSFLQRGVRVLVTEAAGRRIVVQAAPPEPQPSSVSDSNPPPAEQTM